MTRDDLADGDACTNIAGAVRALSVIATCGECGWCEAERSSGIWCERDPRSRAVERDAEPPEWCPLRGKP
jgi:hypothetical protein